MIGYTPTPYYIKYLNLVNSLKFKLNNTKFCVFLAKISG